MIPCNLGGSVPDAGMLAEMVNGEIMCGSRRTSWSSVQCDAGLVTGHTAFFAVDGRLRNDPNGVGVGGHQDGHDYALEAVLAGARVLVVERPISLADVDEDRVTIVRVGDSVAALCAVARFALAGVGAKVIGVTGSTGKTTVTEAISCTLDVLAKPYKVQLSRTTLIGLALEIVNRMPRDASHLVVEMQMDQQGQIAALCDVARPDVACITCVNSTHYSRLGSRDAILEAKTEIYRSLRSNGRVAVNKDDSMLRSWLETVPGDQVVTYGLDPAAHVRALNAQTIGRTAYCTCAIEHDGCQRQVLLNVSGAHHVYTCLAASSVCLQLGFSLDEILHALPSFRGVPSRLTCFSGREGALIVDDTYNASPASFAAAIDAVRAMQVERRIGFVGPMFELGTELPAALRELGRRLPEAFDRVYLVGRQAEVMGRDAVASRELRGAALFMPTVDSAIVEARRLILDSNTLVLVKGSGGARMERIVPYLLASHAEAG